MVICCSSVLCMLFQFYQFNRAGWHAYAMVVLCCTVEVCFCFRPSQYDSYCQFIAAELHLAFLSSIVSAFEELLLGAVVRHLLHMT